ncbi:MAG: HAMP domain-containing histidine kinase [Tannerellaceae bacterium]|jgi:signal transduction histidine kinase|nr:HAMP domain-containing histidine kinase [Tannerellaceae bacterium]
MDSIKAIKRRFTVIIGSISLLFIINLFYLKGLYHAIMEDTTKVMISSIEEADGEELQNRLTVISSLSDSENEEITINKSIVIEDNDSSKETNEYPLENMLVFSQLMKDVRQTVHQSIDTIIPPDLPSLDSLIVVNYRSKGISTQLYHSEIVNMNTGAVLASSRRTAGKIGNSYLYEYDTENRYAYKVYMASMTRSVLGRMSGILLTTLLIIFILGYAFWYFIRTIVRQKTLEEMKQDFTNNMTHELKTPISVAYSAVDTLLNFKQGESREKRKQYLNICIEQLSNLRDLVEQILSMSMDRTKCITLQKENIALKPLFVRIAEQQKLKSDKPVDMEILVQPENLVVYADMAHISNIVGNLIDNALKYSSDQVIIRMSAWRDEKNCLLSIKDNGIGISMENQKHIFDRFYRVPYGNLHKVKGYGLGLFHVKTMVDRYEGKISVKSEIGKGSEFIIKIPIK